MNTKLITNLKAMFTYNSSRVHLQNFLLEAAQSLGAQNTVLDAGSGEGYYKSLFKNTNYYSTDFIQVDKPYGEVSFVGKLENIPIKQDVFDAVLLTQVLEHLPDPSLVLDEIYRILKPEGKVWLSAPLFFSEHEVPYDFYRYTQYGLRYIVEKAGFEIVDLHPLEGYGATFSYQLKYAIKHLPIHPKEYGSGIIGFFISAIRVLLTPLFLILSKLLDISDQKNKITKSGMCKNYCIVAKKPKTQQSPISSTCTTCNLC